ncbi:hypothetical protein [Pantoea sp. Mhis]|uniref:hypothetical protein n=1 Tax=Pantoea sp. Mhis TaxID=2576759 RepID=UPI0013594D86|nr:hypothetical protein [Pantoea sp. Mhis]
MNMNLNNLDFCRLLFSKCEIYHISPMLLKFNSIIKTTYLHWFDNSFNSSKNNIT